MLLHPICTERGGVFRKDGLYYARLERPFVDEPLEVVLHGVVSEDQARAAFEVLITPPGHDGRQLSDL